MTVRTTAYTAAEPGGAHSACGELLHFGGTSNTYSAAADWSWMPLGTRFQMPATGRTYVVEDYGSALVGRKTIDLFMPSRSEMNSWGVRNVDIEILEWGSTAMSLRLLEPRQRNEHVRRMVAAMQHGKGGTLLARDSARGRPRDPRGTCRRAAPSGHTRHRNRGSSSARSPEIRHSVEEFRRKIGSTICIRARPAYVSLHWCLCCWVRTARLLGGRAVRFSRGPARASGPPEPSLTRRDRCPSLRPSMKIQRALISVSDKTGLVEFARGLVAPASRSSPPAAPPRCSTRKASPPARSPSSPAFPR